MNTKNEETIWKKKIFSNDSKNKKDIEDLDVLKIENKIKKINKRKRSKENFKNMEELQNIYESKNEDEQSIEDTKKREKRKKEPVKEPLMSDFFKCSKPEETIHNNKESMETNPIIEGYGGNEYKKSIEPPVKPKDDGSAKYYFLYIKFIADWIQYIIFFLYFFFIYTIYNFSYKITKQYSSDGENNDVLDLLKESSDFSNKAIVDNIKSNSSKDDDKKTSTINEKNLESDATVLTNIIISIAIFPLLTIMTYNWFYLTCYYNEDSDTCKGVNEKKDPDTYIFCRPTNDNARTPITWGKEAIVNFLLDFLIAPLALIDQFFLGTNINIFNLVKAYNDVDYKSTDSFFTIPNFMFFMEKQLKTIQLPSKIIQKFLMALISFFILYGVSFFSSVKSSVNISTISIIFIILFFHFCRTLVQYFVVDLKKLFLGSPDATPPIESTFKGSNPIIRFFSMLLSGILIFFLRFVIGFFSLTISFIISVIFLWFHSLFGLAYYETKVGGEPVSFGNKFTDINNFINQDIAFLKVNEDCKDSNILIKLIKFFIRTLNGNFFVLFFILLLIINLSECSKFNSLNIQLGTYYILSILILFCIIKILFLTPTD